MRIKNKARTARVKHASFDCAMTPMGCKGVRSLAVPRCAVLRHWRRVLGEVPERSNGAVSKNAFQCIEPSDRSGKPHMIRIFLRSSVAKRPIHPSSARPSGWQFGWQELLCCHVSFSLFMQPHGRSPMAAIEARYINRLCAEIPPRCARGCSRASRQLRVSAAAHAIGA